jgi:phage-related protein
MQLLGYIFGGDQTVDNVAGNVSLQRIITNINGLTGMKGLGAKVAVLKSLFEAIGVIATTAKTLKDTFAGAAAITAEQLQPGFASINVVLSAFLNGGPAAFLANMDMTNITKAHNKLVGSGGRGSSGIGAKLGAIGTAFSDMIKGMTTIKTELTNFGTQFPAGGSTFNFDAVRDVTTDLLHKMDGLAESLAGSDSGMIQRITETFTGRGFMAKVRTAVQSYNSFSRELSGLRGGDVNVSLRALNNSLVGRANQDLASTSARINVNVNVRMDAANVSRVLYDYSHTEQSNVNGDAHGPTGAIRTNAYNTPT